MVTFLQQLNRGQTLVAGFSVMSHLLHLIFTALHWPLKTIPDHWMILNMVLLCYLTNPTTSGRYFCESGRCKKLQYFVTVTYGAGKRDLITSCQETLMGRQVSKQSVKRQAPICQVTWSAQADHMLRLNVNWPFNLHTCSLDILAFSVKFRATEPALFAFTPPSNQTPTFISVDGIQHLINIFFPLQMPPLCKRTLRCTHMLSCNICPWHGLAPP